MSDKMSDDIDKLQEIVEYLEEEHPRVHIRESYIEPGGRYGVTNLELELEW